TSPYYYTDNDAEYGASYDYYVTAWDYLGNEQDLSDATANATVQAFPKSYSLEQPYPNPANSTVNFVFTTPRKDDLTIKIYDIKGRCVTSLHDGPISGGVHTVSADLSTLAMGVYICEMKGSDFEEVTKFVISR
ncbi:MAG: T9SS type A sorting domain-containing protein, partial [bacterium]|nr:T9SS type A sorting domain-containing protein [bacterium]